MRPGTRWRFPLHLHLSVVFVSLVVLIGVTLSALAYRLAHDTLEAVAEDLVDSAGQNLGAELKLLFAPARMATEALAGSQLGQAATLDLRLSRLPMLRDMMDTAPSMAAMYVGQDDGSFFLMRRLADATEARSFAAPEATRYLVQSIERAAHAGSVGRHLFFDGQLQALGEQARPDYPQAYDPRQRPWYRAAQAQAGLAITPPYVFFTQQQVGVTLSRRGTEQRSVVGVDILLDTLSRSLAKHKVTPGTQMVLVNARGEVLAHAEAHQLLGPSADGLRPALNRLDRLDSPVMRQLAARLPLAVAQSTADAAVLEVDGATWRTALRPMPMPRGAPVYLALAIPDRELFAPALALRRSALLLMAGIVLLAVPLAWWLARRISGSLRLLAQDADSIAHFDFRQPVAVRSSITEVDLLATTMDSMKGTIRRFLDVQRALTAEEDFDCLMALLLRETVSASKAAAGVLYLLDGDALRAAGALDEHGNDQVQQVLPPTSAALAEVAREGARAVPDAQLAELGAAGLADVTGAREAVLLPLVNRKHQVLGALLLLHRDPPEEQRVAFVAALSGSSASALETRELIQAQKLLFESFIQLIASAIDAKSPYTGGHCARVPALTKMLARAACRQSDGPFAAFQLDDDGWEQLHVAAWLHDCGKVTTPEYVVDKATKLETLYDRLHEVRMRFEVLKRDAEIACLQAIARGTPAAEAEATRNAAWAQLDDDFAFVAACNQGGEFMAPERIERLLHIAQRRWLRTLDDRIGLGHVEAERKARSPAAPLPVWEPLLADRPEHRIERQAAEHLPDGHGFDMHMPELLYHQGELHNLRVARGTLSEEERYKINEHIVQTIVMLERLPFPKHLRDVPEIAGGHHEKMDGTGYPRRLSRNDMSPQARMMAIADIFEALTAEDRPYKKGKSLSEAVRIMAGMARTQHIDAELFALFLREGVHLEYARAFLQPHQIDAVDVEAALA